MKLAKFVCAVGPSDVSISPKKPVFYDGDVITCSANAYPPPQFRWEYENGLFISEGSRFRMDDAKLRKGINKLRCNASTEFASNNSTIEFEYRMRGMFTQVHHGESHSMFVIQAIMIYKARSSPVEAI